MTNEEFIDYLNTASCRESIIDHARKLVAVVEFSKALKGDFDAKDEQPTHFASWFNFIDALKDLERESVLTRMPSIDYGDAT